MEYPENRYSTIHTLINALELSPEGAVISDMRRKDQPIIYCNQTFLDMSGYDEEEVVGRNCRFLQREDECQPALDTLRAAIKAEKPCKVVLRNYRKNGDLFFNRLSISPIFNGEGTLTHFMGIQDDVTSIISMRKELEKAEKENEVLLAEVHHRVKNNLSIMSSLLELEKNNKNEAGTLEKSRLRVHSMSLIHEMLYQKKGLAYIEVSNLIKELSTRQHISDEQCMANLRFDFELKKGELNINQAIPLSIILSELFHNIALHAYRDGKGGDVRVSMENSNDSVFKFTIIDYGIGLPESVSFSKPQTLGFIVVQTLLKQINARAEIIDRDDIGFGLQILLPKSDRKGTAQSKKVGALH